MLHFVSAVVLILSTLMSPVSLEAKKIDPKDKEIASTYQSNRYGANQGKGKAFSQPFIDTAKQTTPAVVFIEAEGVQDYGQDPFEFFNDDFFNRFFGAPPRRRQQQQQISQGSGFIVSSEGYIVTNFHVVRGAKKITVVLHDGIQKEVPASFVGGDDRTDVAIIKLTEPLSGGYPYLEFGNSDEVEVGEWVLAIGSPFHLEATVTAGIISAKGRQNLQITDIEDFLQTDAAINPGNSGGPLIDLDGRVIGMNTAIVSRSGGYMGIGFAIPSNMLKNIKDQIIDRGSVSRGYLGVSLQPIDKDLAESFKLNAPEGALVVDVIEGSPAADAGLKQGDIILQMDGHPIKSPSTLRNMIMLLNPNTKVMLTINRSGKILKIPVMLGTQGQSSYMSSKSAPNLLGVTVDNLTSENIQTYKLQNDDKGVIIIDVQAGTPAANAGLKKGFLVVAVNHQKVQSVKDFDDALKDSKQNDRVLILVRQGSMMRFYSIKL